jgi:hypothetical protein
MATAKLAWEYLDSLPDADAIADALRKAGVKGKRRSATLCPLARATGWRVTPYVRWRLRSRKSVEHSRAEYDFIYALDSGKYPDLEES